jgi:hypothetical protein
MVRELDIRAEGVRSFVRAQAERMMDVRGLGALPRVQETLGRCGKLSGQMRQISAQTCDNEELNLEVITERKGCQVIVELRW